LLLGTLLLTVLIAPFTIIAWGITAIPYLGPVAVIGLVYLSLGLAKVNKEGRVISQALQNNELAQARERLTEMVTRDTQGMNEEEVSLAMVETVLKSGCRVSLGAFFWLLIAGGSGVVAYHLLATLNTLWGHATPRYRYFGRPAAHLHALFEWIPARLTALSYTLLGDRKTAWRCWCHQASHWGNCNSGPMLAAGAGALNLQLGGSARYFGRLVQRPPLGAGLLPRSPDIERAINLLNWSVGLWIGVVGLGEWLLT
jgi:adenosylcobinamide-phosphate synthase